MNQEGSQGKIISIDEGLVKSQLGQTVRETVEETLNKPQPPMSGRLEITPASPDTVRTSRKCVPHRCRVTTYMGACQVTTLGLLT